MVTEKDSIAHPARSSLLQAQRSESVVLGAANERALSLARVGALLYTGWGLFHLRVAWDIMMLGVPEIGLIQGRLFQLAAYMLTISVFVISVALRLNWRNDQRGYWLNLCVAGWADAIWVAVVVLPGYVGLARGLVPPAVFVAGAILTNLALRAGATSAFAVPTRDAGISDR